MNEQTKDYGRKYMNLPSKYKPKIRPVQEKGIFPVQAITDWR